MNIIARYKGIFKNGKLIPTTSASILVAGQNTVTNLVLQGYAYKKRF
jgi:hypothetical protein